MLWCSGVLSFLILLSVTQCQKQYSCSPDDTVVAITLEIGETVALSSYNYPNITRTNCDVKVKVKGSGVLLIQYIHLSYNGTIEYRGSWGNKTRFPTSVYDDSFEASNHAEFIMNPEQDLAIRFNEPVINDQSWNGFKALLIYSAVMGNGCPMTSDAPIVVEDTLLLFPDFPFSSHEKKHCIWVIEAPPAGYELALSYIKQTIFERAGEQLSVQGNSSPSVESDFKNCSRQGFECCDHFESRFVVDFKRTRNSDFQSQSFKILITKTQSWLKKCSWSINYLPDYSRGSFRNIVPFKTYPKNELCQFKIPVPSNSNLSLEITKCDIGFASGDRLFMSTSYGALSLLCWRDDLKDGYHFATRDERAMVLISWASDATYEYNGFELNYRIDPISGAGASDIILQWLVVAQVMCCILFL